LLVGRGLSNETTTVMSLRGLTLEQAIAKAHSFSLDIGATLYDVPPKSESEKALYFVYRQEPIAGSKVSLGQSINLFLTKDKTLLDTPEETIEDDTTDEELWN
jgi:beta-lactam-binding protein with PASTA domain